MAHNAIEHRYLVQELNWPVYPSTLTFSPSSLINNRAMTEVTIFVSFPDSPPPLSLKTDKMGVRKLREKGWCPSRVSNVSRIYRRRTCLCSHCKEKRLQNPRAYKHEYLPFSINRTTMYGMVCLGPVVEMNYSKNFNICCTNKCT